MRFRHVSPFFFSHCRTFRGLVLRWSSSTSFCSSRRNTSPTMPQLPFLICRSTPTSCSKYRSILIMWPLDGKPPTMAPRLRDFVFSSPPARALSAENPDLVQLKSLLAGLTLPVKRSSAEVAPEERDGKDTSILWVRACLCVVVFCLRVKIKFKIFAL